MTLLYKSTAGDWNTPLYNPYPFFNSNIKGKEEGPRNNTECAICLGEFEEEDWIKHLPNCTHAFHVACIDTWFQSYSNCPLCISQADHIFVSMNTLRETLKREEYFRLRAAHYLTVRTQVLRKGMAMRWKEDLFFSKPIWQQKFPRSGAL